MATSYNHPLQSRMTYAPVSYTHLLMVLKAYTGFSDRQLVEHLNGNIHFQIFCGIMIPPSLPITNFKIVSAIRNEIASRLDIDSFQELLARINVKAGCYLITDGTDYLEVGYGKGRGNHNSTENLEMCIRDRAYI